MKMKNENTMVLLNTAHQKIQAAKSIPEVKQIIDQGKAVKEYVEQQRLGFEIKNDVAEIVVRAEYRAGELLREIELNKGAATPSSKRSTLPQLKEFGVTWNQSSAWQNIAEIPVDEFEETLQETKEKQKEITTKGFVNLGKKHKKKKETTKKKNNIEKGLKKPNGKFDIIVCDPPWNYGREYDPDSSRVASPYPEMTQEQLLKEPLPNYAEKDCILWLWTTDQFIWDAKELLEHWGFKYKAILTWDKEKMGIGSWLRLQCEYCLLGIKGHPLWEHKDIRDIIRMPRTEHSAKPDLFYQMIDEKFIGKKLDYFFGKERLGWSRYGTGEHSLRK